MAATESQRQEKSRSKQRLTVKDFLFFKTQHGQLGKELHPQRSERLEFADDAALAEDKTPCAIKRKRTRPFETQEEEKSW